MTLKVCETFYSLMGESTRVGLPAWFIRLSGCNLRCTYCDTAYAYEEGREVAVADLLQAAGTVPHVLVNAAVGILHSLQPIESPADQGDKVALAGAGFRQICRSRQTGPV